jgi:predicted ATP-grasp superfamily ATP-dependent carboligase
MKAAELPHPARTMSVHPHGRRAPVVVTGSECPAGLALLRAVHAGGDAPIAAVTRPDALGAVSRAAQAVEVVHDPSGDPEAFARDVGAVAARHGATVLPGTEPALRALAHHRDQLPDSVVAGCPSAAVVDRVLAKGALDEIAAAGGLRTPPTRVLSADSADCWDGGFPAVVKPVSSYVPQADGTMEHGLVLRVRDRAGLASALAGLPAGRGLVQPYLAGEQRTVDGLAWEGEVVAIAQKTGDRTWPRDCGVLSYGRIVRPDPELERCCREMLADARWSGLFNLQFLDAPGGRFLIDFNPRAWNSLAVQVEAGANMPAAWVDLLLGRPVRPAVPRPGRQFRSEIDDVRSLWAAWRGGQRSAAVRGLLPRRRTTHAIFSWTDPAPALHVLRRRGYH